VVRLCLCVVVDLDPTATVTGFRIVEGYMKSAAGLTYPGVARALGFTPNPPRSPEAEAMREQLQVMWDLARLLRARRMRRGALDFDLPEAKVILDPETGTPLAVQKRAHDPGVAKAYHLIEELMLLANETVARFLVERDVPAVFRDHAPPDEAKLDRFATMCAELDLKFELEDALDPKLLSAMLKKIAAHPQKQVLHMLLLRAMKQAVYDTVNVGHFGLASSAAASSSTSTTPSSTCSCAWSRSAPIATRSTRKACASSAAAPASASPSATGCWSRSRTCRSSAAPSPAAASPTRRRSAPSGAPSAR
jgi:ribonuclease R